MTSQLNVCVDMFHVVIAMVRASTLFHYQTLHPLHLEKPQHLLYRMT